MRGWVRISNTALFASFAEDASRKLRARVRKQQADAADTTLAVGGELPIIAAHQVQDLSDIPAHWDKSAHDM